MNALIQPEASLRPMRVGDLETVMAVERSAYRFPWTRGNFIDSLAAGYLAEMLVHDQAGLVGYYLAMKGVDEMHLLNLTVAPALQRRGHSRTLLDALEQRCHDQHVGTVWLEVRASNDHARRVYARRGFAEVGLRRAYYPAGPTAREDAIVMSLGLRARSTHGLD
ncbi:MAG: ribosomal protein S18-alanine N-acetyltransferase [Rubrivivax sp.]